MDAKTLIDLYIAGDRDFQREAFKFISEIAKLKVKELKAGENTCKS